MNECIEFGDRAWQWQPEKRTERNRLETKERKKEKKIVELSYIMSPYFILQISVNFIIFSQATKKQKQERKNVYSRWHRGENDNYKWQVASNAGGTETDQNQCREKRMMRKKPN